MDAEIRDIFCRALKELEKTLEAERTPEMLRLIEELRQQLEKAEPEQD